MMRALLPTFVLGLASCGLEMHSGEARVDGSIQGLNVSSPNAAAIAINQGTRVRLAATNLACELTLGGADHVTIDLATPSTGTFHLIPGYPLQSSLSALQARAHACPADKTAPCHDMVQNGTVTITRFDSQVGGTIEGTFAITFRDGQVSGAFTALRCDGVYE